MLPRRYGVCALMVFSFCAQAEVSDREYAEACAKIPGYAHQGESAYQAKNYAKARDAFELQAMWSESCEYDNKALATAYNNIALTWIREKQYRKAQAWLNLLPRDPKSVYNLNLIKDKLAALPPSSSPAGEYWQYAGGAAWNTLTLKAGKSADRYQADFMGYYFGMTGALYGPNTGEFSAPLTLKDGKGVIALREADYIHCDIAVTATPDAIDLKTDNPQECGFGHNVDANGQYVRVN